MPDLTDKQFQQKLDELERNLRARIDAATRDLPDDSGLTREQRVGRAQADPRFFREYYFPHLYSGPLSPNHDALQAKRGQWQRLLEMAFRGWGKSTDETYVATVEDLVCERARFQVLTSKTDEQTFPLVLQVRMELEANARLAADFGPFRRGGLWRADHFALADGREILGRSLGSGSRGPRSLENRRPQRWRLDDLQERVDAKNPETIAAILDYIDSTVLPAMDPENQAVRVVGTRMGEDCAISKLKSRAEEADAAWGLFELPAWDADEQPCEPARFSKAFLTEQRRAMGTDAFNREYLHKAEAKDGVFLRAWIARERREPWMEMPTIFGVFWDPAIRAKAGGDFKAIVSWMLDLHAGRYFCPRAFVRQEATPAQQAAEFWTQWQMLSRNMTRTGTLGYEANGFQVLLGFPIEEARKALKCPPAPIRQVVNTINKEIRVGAMAPLFEQLRMVFPVVEESTPDIERLIEQFVFWPRNGLDGPDATRGALQLIAGLLGAHGAASLGPTEMEGWDAQLSA